MHDHHVQISAHRGGDVPGGPVTRHTFEAAAATEAEFVELDIRRTGDGTLVVHHGPRVGRWGPRLRDLSYERVCELTGYRVPRVPDTLALIAGRAIGHLDLKEAGYEDDVVRLALEILGPGGFVVTTTDGSSIAHIRRRFPALATALSLGHAADQARRLAQGFSCAREVIRRVHDCGANWLAVNHRLAGADVLAACAAHGIPCMVWTVNSDANMARFLADPRVTVLVTDRPGRALRLRADLRAAVGAVGVGAVGVGKTSGFGGIIRRHEGDRLYAHRRPGCPATRRTPRTGARPGTGQGQDPCVRRQSD